MSDGALIRRWTKSVAMTGRNSRQLMMQGGSAEKPAQKRLIKRPWNKRKKKVSLINGVLQGTGDKFAVVLQRLHGLRWAFLESFIALLLLCPTTAQWPFCSGCQQLTAAALKAFYFLQTFFFPYSLLFQKRNSLPPLSTSTTLEQLVGQLVGFKNWNAPVDVWSILRPDMPVQSSPPPLLEMFEF